MDSQPRSLRSFAAPGNCVRHVRGWISSLLQSRAHRRVHDWRALDARRTRLVAWNTHAHHAGAARAGGIARGELNAIDTAVTRAGTLRTQLDGVASDDRIRARIATARVEHAFVLGDTE